MVNTTSPPQHPWPHSLPDQANPLLSFYSHHLSLYSDLRAFVEGRAQLERDYAVKLKAMVGKLRDKELKERKVVLLTVGEESSRGWEEGLEMRNTLLKSLSTHLQTLTTISDEHLRLADSLQSQVIDEMRKSGEKKEAGRKKVSGWVDGLGEVREAGEGEVGRAMGKYHQACADLETARLKHSRAARDDKHLPRLLKSYRTALVAKNNARNDYVIALGVGNREKEVFYDRAEKKSLGEGGMGEQGGEGGEDTGMTDPLVTPFGPGIARPQAELQTLFHNSTLRLNSLLSHSSTVYSHFYTAQATYAQSIVQAHEKVDPARDADLYAEWNLRPKLDEAPVLRVFEPCQGFLEEGVITLGGGDQLGFDEPGGKAGLGPAPTNSNANSNSNLNTSHKPEEVVVLQNKLATARESRTRLSGLCAGWRGEIRRGRGVVQAYEENRGLGDPDEIVEAMMITLKDLSLAELKIEALDVEIGMLKRALGDDQGAQKPHDFRNASFAIPTPCEYCKSSIWGITKPGSTCRKCGSNVHVKCANKVPAECTGGSSITTASNRRMSYMFPRKESSTSQSISDLASIASTSKDKEESSLRAIRRSFTSRLHSSDSSSNSAPPPGLSPLAMATPVLPPPHRMTDMDNLDTTGIVGMGSNGSRLHSLASQPVLTSPIQREAGTGRRISMFGAPTGGIASPGGSPMRRRSGDILGGPSRGSPGGSPVIEEEVGGLDPSYKTNGTRSINPSPNGTPGGLLRAKVLFDFEAADDDELTVEKGALVHVIESDDGQGWIKVRLEVQGDSLEGLVPAGYVEVLPTGSTTPQYRPQMATHISPAISPIAQPVMHNMSPVSSPVRHGTSPGFPFNPPSMPGSYSPSSPPVPPMQTRPSISTQGAFGQVTALYDYTAAESDEFALKKGVIYNLSRRGASYDAGWWELSYDDGRTGIAPSNYLRKV